MTPNHFSRSWGAAIVAFVSLLCCSREAFCAVNVDHVNPGFSATPLNWVESNGMFLYSTNQSFAFGFWSLDLGGGIVTYYLCIQHLSSSQNVWCADRNTPVGRADVFSFNGDGSVDLEKIASGTVIWSINSGGEGASAASRLQLLETGNLVLVSNKTETMWQSFDFPTDTILSGQTFSSKMKLVASKSQSDMSEGLYYMSMNGNNSDLALYVNVSSTSSPQLFWTMASDVRSTQLNPGGVPAFAEILMDNLVLLEMDGVTVVSEILLDNFVGSTIRRATLEADGNLHVYFFSGSLWNSALSAVEDVCSLPDCCGAYGLCSNDGQCNCPQPLLPNNSTDFSQGCSQSFGAPPTCPNNQSLSSPFELAELGNVDYYANRFIQPQGPSSLAGCKQLCLSNCSCTALFFHNDTGSCYIWGEIGTIRYDSNGDHTAFLKLLRKTEAPSGNSRKNGSGLATYVVSLIAIGTTFIIMGLFIGALWLYKRRFAQVPKTEEEDDMITSIPGLPTRFSYKELEAATNGFRDKLGSGGFGSVYEGVLGKTKIAVKRLEGVGQGKKEFWAEVATIGSIHHVHLVQLRGFCVEASHRLLVYEFMANGSLAKVLFSTNKDEPVLDWPTRCKISVGTARGLAYLHDDCRERIIHCDIKPENILLDEHFIAKVADFGLAKLMNPEQSEVFTTLRGTRGYLAPEWLLNSAISDRSDVYSFGMVLLELISGRKNFDPTDFSEKGYFPIYAFCRVEIGDFLELVDPKLDGLVDEDQVAKLARIALWCIQDEVAIRPSMRKVVKMLEGIVDVPNPPQSPQLAVRLHGRRFDSSGNDSGLFDFDKSKSSSATSRLSASRLSAPR